MNLVALPLNSDSIAEETYVGYSYSYPHKSAYGPLEPARSLRPLWQDERRDALFLYWHIPFCEMRCGFCNLFARAGGDDRAVDAYLDALERQTHVMAAATAGDRLVSRMAVGGGTPTYLTAGQLERLFDLAEQYFAASPQQVPTSVETSPKTALPDRLHVLRRRGVDRVSLGVQSFIDDETHAMGRPQSAQEVRAALERLRAFPRLNIDLIYGGSTQTITSWIYSVRTALSYEPDELYLYPLYVRPGTGLGRRGSMRRSPAHALRLLYREARDLLRAHGYEQVSMRCFQKERETPAVGPVYCCQTDDMLGLGCGARSYTTRLHYSSRFGVESTEVHAILEAWTRQSETDFGRAAWGCVLSEDDRRRRFVLQSLLTCAGLVESELKRLFQVCVADVVPELAKWIADGLIERTAGRVRLTSLRLECSDWIGPALYSPSNRAQFEKFALS